MKAQTFRIQVAACICLVLLAAAGGAIAQCTFTGDIDTDFLGKPNTTIKDGATLTPPYLITDGPVNPLGPNGTQDIVTGGVIPSGFHLSRTAISYDCASDTLCVGYDVSNQSTFNAVPVPGMISRAWDADGDGDACIVTNPLLVRNCTEPTCGGSTKHIDPLRLGNDDQPTNGQGEVYVVEMDLNRDGFTDVTLQAIANGFVAGTVSGAVEFKGPCDQDPTHLTPDSWTDVIHVTLRDSVGHNLLLVPGISVNLFYVQNKTDASYPTNRDIEFQIVGLRNVELPAGIGTDEPVCELNLHTFADSQFDASGEVDLDWGAFSFVTDVNLGVTCSKTVSSTEICSLPTTVTYTLSATNTSDIPALVNIQDPTLGINQTSESCVDPGQSFQIEQQVTYDATYCGHEPIVNSMTATIIPESCNCMPCLRVTGDTTCESTATVKFPTAVNAAVSCSKTVDTPQVCTLPATVTFTLTATNTGDTPVMIRIQDTALDVDQTSSECVPVGENFQITKQVTYDSTYCAHADIVNTMTASADACATCACGTLTATCTSSATVKFPSQGNAAVTCSKTVDTPQLCTLPATVTYTLTATNSGPSPAKIRIQDTQLEIDQTSADCIPAGQTFQVTKQVTYDATYCGREDLVNTMTATAELCGDSTCACGSATASCTSSATVKFPTTGNVALNCSKTVDKPQLCVLPATVTYTLTVTNSGDTPARIRIQDADLGVDQTSDECIPVGESYQVQKQATYDATYCGHADLVNTMTATAEACGGSGCSCGTGTASCTSTATLKFPGAGDSSITCSKTVDKPNLCTLPATVTYTLKVTNTGDTPAKLRIQDSVLRIDKTSCECIAPGKCFIVTKQVCYDSSYCGHDDIVNTMTATAQPCGSSTCSCGSSSASCTSSATVTFPKPAHPSVSCVITADPPRVCTLPTTVTFTLTATNTGDVPIKITIKSDRLCIWKTSSECVPVGQSFTVTKQVTYGSEYCGRCDLAISMTASFSMDRCATCICQPIRVLCDPADCQSSLTLKFPRKGKVDITCCKTVDEPCIRSLPDTVTYMLKATNVGDVPARIRIQDTDLGVDLTSDDCIPPGKCFVVNKQVTYDATYCGHADIVNTMTATAAVCGDATCMCGATTDKCTSSATVKFPKGRKSCFTCSKTVNGVKDLCLTTCDLPKSLTYVLKACNTGETNLDFTIEDMGTMPPGTVCSSDLPASFTNVPPGQCRQVTCTVTVTKDMVTGKCPVIWEDTVNVTATPSEGQGCIGQPQLSPCTSTVTVKVTPTPGATRTPGFWQTHPTALCTQVGHCGPWSFGCAQATTVNDALALMLDSISKLRSGKSRSDLGHARMQLAQQLVAAYANVCAFGTEPPVALSTISDAMGAGDIHDILGYVTLLDAYNNSGDAVPFPRGFNQGPADPYKAKNLAWQSNITQGSCFK